MKMILLIYFYCMNEEVKKYFDYERKTCYIFEDYYKKHNFRCKRTYGKENIKQDCHLLIEGHWWKVEEKMRDAEAKKWNDILVENIQDLKTNAPGWIRETEAEILLYAFDDGMIYAIDMNKLKKLVKENNFETRISEKGWGETENFMVPLQTIFDNNIGVLVCIDPNEDIYTYEIGEIETVIATIEIPKKVIKEIPKEAEKEITVEEIDAAIEAKKYKVYPPTDEEMDEIIEMCKEKFDVDLTK